MFIYSISDNDLFSMYKDKWEEENQHNFPELTQDETKRLKADISDLVRKHMAEVIDQFLNEKDTLTGLVHDVHYRYDTLRDLGFKMLNERIAKARANDLKVQEAVRLLANTGYEVKKI